MPADGLTKPLLAQQHAAFVEQLHLMDIAKQVATERPQEDPHQTDTQEEIDTLRYAYLGDI